MRLLLDTHTFIWWAQNDPALGLVAKQAIADRTNEVFLSATSTWEMAIKIGIGKLTLAIPLEQFVLSQLLVSQFKTLQITFEHTYRVQTLAQHHRDPFDRLLVAQALVENLTLVSADPLLAPYGAPIIW